MIPYWNLLPLKAELMRQKYGNMNLTTGYPSVVNQWLIDGQIDIAPCSSVCLVSQQDFEMALPLGIVSSGPAKSVYLGFSHEHEASYEHILSLKISLQEIFHQAQSLHGCNSRKIAAFIWSAVKELPKPASDSIIYPLKFSAQSATSAALSRIFYRFWFGEEAYETYLGRSYSSKPSFDRKPIELMIGDEALLRKRLFYKTLDLGAYWKDISGLPFVFAVWQSKGACLNGWRRKILSAGELAETRMKVEPGAYLPQIIPADEQGKPINLPDYWKNIYYRLGPQEFKGLLIFLCLTRQLQSIPLGESLVSKLMRWENIVQTGVVPQP